MEARALGDRLVVAVNADATVADAQGPRQTAHAARRAHGDPRGARRRRLRRWFRRGDADRDHRRDRPRRARQGRRLDPGPHRRSRDRRAVGGRVLSLPFAPGYSTSAIIERIVLETWRESAMSAPGARSSGRSTGSRSTRRSREDAPAHVSGLMGPARALVLAAARHPEAGARARRRARRETTRSRRVRPRRPFSVPWETRAPCSRSPRSLSIPYRGLSPHLDVTSARLEALVALLDGRRVVVVATAAACLYRTASSSSSRRASLDAPPGVTASTPVSSSDGSWRPAIAMKTP